MSSPTCRDMSATFPAKLMVDKAGTKKQQRHHQQLTNSSTILKTFTLPVSLD